MGALFTQERSGPPFDLDERLTPFSAFLRDASGSNDMGVIATPASPQIFFVPASPDTDIYVRTLQFTISALSMDFGDFANVLPLTDPCILGYKTESRTVVLSDQLASNADFVLLAQGQPAFGTLADAFKGQSPAQGMDTDDAYFPSLDFRKVYSLPWGIKLPVGRDTELSLTIRDDTTAATTFTAEAFGFIRFPDAGSIGGE